jgi:hypothetical protein
LQVTTFVSATVVAIENDTEVPADRLAVFDDQGRVTLFCSGDCPLTTSLTAYFVVAEPPVARNWTLRAEESLVPQPASSARPLTRKATALRRVVALLPHRRGATAQGLGDLLDPHAR